MKKISKLLLVFTIILGLSGCLKYDVNMQISNDKSMDFDLVIAINTSMLESLGQTTSKEFKKDDYLKYENVGYTVTEYNETNDKATYEGVRISKNFKNIDKLTTDKDEEVEFTSLFNDEANPEKVKFFYKNGNTYKANLTFNLVDEEGNSNTEDYLEYQSYFDLEYKVTLPEKPISSNATSVSEDGKTLTWKMTYGKKNSVQYEFKLGKDEIKKEKSITSYIGSILPTIGVVIILIVALVVQNKKKTPKEKKETN